MCLHHDMPGAAPKTWRTFFHVGKCVGMQAATRCMSFDAFLQEAARASTRSRAACKRAVHTSSTHHISADIPVPHNTCHLAGLCRVRPAYVTPPPPCASVNTMSSSCSAQEFADMSLIIWSHGGGGGGGVGGGTRDGLSHLLQSSACPLRQHQCEGCQSQLVAVHMHRRLVVSAVSGQSVPRRWPSC